MDWPNIIGGLIGVVVGFLLSELRGYINRRSERRIRQEETAVKLQETLNDALAIAEKLKNNCRDALSVVMNIKAARATSGTDMELQKSTALAIRQLHIEDRQRDVANKVAAINTIRDSGEPATNERLLEAMRLAGALGAMEPEIASVIQKIEESAPNEESKFSGGACGGGGNIVHAPFDY